MRKDQTFKAEADKKRDREALKARRANLAGLQQRLKQAGLPVIVLVEGWGAGRKGERDPLPDPGAGPPVFQGDQCLHAHRGGTPLALPEALRSEHPGGGKGPLPGLGMDG